MTLKQKIEHMIKSSRPELPDDVRSIPESLPDGELRDLDLRLKQMSTLIEKGDSSADVIQKELEEVEEELARVNPRRSGVRRLKIQLASAKNKLMGLKSKQAIAGADRMMANLSSSIHALEKTWKQSDVRQSPSKVVPKASPARRPVDVLFPVTPTKSYEPQSSQVTEEKDPYGKWMNYTETIRSQEHMIAKLKKQLLHAAHKAKDLENREVRLSEKEAVLRALEKQLESLNLSIEKRVKAITVKETGLKAREVSLLEAADAENKEKAALELYTQLETRVRSEEAALAGQLREIEHEKMKLLAMKEETLGREKHLAKVQRILARENLRMEKEKKKLESLRQELSHLLPSLQSLAKPKD
jgi:DNA repair exonuclease SbcCD ATPase subunit